MHVLIVAPEGLPIPAARGGSVQIYLQSLIAAIDANASTEFTLLSPGTERQKLRAHNLTHLVYTKQTRSSLRYPDWVLTQIKRVSPDVVQIENRPKLALKVLRLRQGFPQLNHTKVVLNLHSSTFLGPLRGSHAAVRHALMQADQVVLNSRYLKRTVRSRFNLSNQQMKSRVIYPGVDASRFRGIMQRTQSEAEASRQDGSSPAIHQPVRLIFIGRVIELKGVTVLIKAVRRLVQNGVPVSLTIVGRTPPWERQYGIRTKKMSRGLPIVWKGFVVPRQLPGLLNNHDILVCPSQRREAFGLVNLEAMAAGKPVIASRVGGIPEVVSHDSGILVDNYRSSIGFADAVARLVRNPEKYRELHEGALKRAGEFSWSHTFKAFHQLYDDLSIEHDD